MSTRSDSWLALTAGQSMSSKDIDRMERHLTGNHLSVQLVRLMSHPVLCLWSLTGLQFVSRTARGVTCSWVRLCVTSSRPIISQTWIYGYGFALGLPRHVAKAAIFVWFIYLARCLLLTVICGDIKLVSRQLLRPASSSPPLPECWCCCC